MNSGLIVLHQCPHPHAQQTQLFIQRHPFEALARHTADGGGVGGVRQHGLVTRGGFEVVVAQLDADGFAHIALALQVVGHLFTQPGEDAAQLGLVVHGMQVAVERGLAAHGHRFTLGDNRSFITAARHFKHPCPGGLAKGGHQPVALACGQVTNGVNAMALQLLVGLGANAVDLAAGQRPDLGLQIVRRHDGNTVGFVELTRHLGQQFVGGHTDRTGQPGGLQDGLLDQPRQHTPALALASRHIGEVDVHLVHTPVFHHRGNLADGVLEQARQAAHFVKVHRQHQCLRAEFGGLHHAHGRADTKLAGSIGGGGDDTPAYVVLQQRKRGDRNVGQRAAFGDVADGFVHLATAATNHHGQALELRVTQQLDRRKKSVHVEVGDAARQRRRGRRRSGCGHTRYFARRVLTISLRVPPHAAPGLCLWA